MWIYKGNKFTKEMIADNYAFVYIITDETNGKKYIGKKVFYFKKTLKPLKGKKNKRHKKIESDWEDYYGSSKVLLDEIEKKGKHNFTREIVSLHPNKTEANYHEMKLQFMMDVLETRDDNGERLFYNENINCKFYPSKQKKIIEHRKKINEEYCGII